MRIQTFSIVVGTRACNAQCPFCVSRMTGFGELPKRRAIVLGHFHAACQLAVMNGTTTVLFTGKGEPTLYPSEITEYLRLLQEYRFPLIEIQTNALLIGRLARDGISKHPGFSEDVLREWRALGLKTIAISVISDRVEHNRCIYHEDYPPLDGTIAYLRQLGFTVRLCVMMQKYAVDSPGRVRDIIAFCRANDVQQLTLRPIRRPLHRTDDGEASRYVMEYGLASHEIRRIRDWVLQESQAQRLVRSVGDRVRRLGLNGRLGQAIRWAGRHIEDAVLVDTVAHHERIMSLMHGAVVLDIDGQNVCLSDCLTTNRAEDRDDIRTLIYYANGLITHSWHLPGAVVLGAVEDEAAGAELVQLRTSPQPQSAS